MDDVTHLILDIGYASRLNEHIPQIQEDIEEKFGVSVECLFTFEGKAMPAMFVPHSTPEKRAEAQQIRDVTQRFITSGPICFKIPKGGSIALFDIVDIISAYECCSFYSNVVGLHVVPHKTKKILILAYLTDDD